MNIIHKMFKNKKKESEKKRRIRELTELVETNEEKYQIQLAYYKKHIEDNKLLLDNISNSYDGIVNDNKKLREQLLKRDKDIFNLKQEIQSKLEENVTDVQNLKFLFTEQTHLLDLEKKKTHEYKRKSNKYHFMNSLMNELNS